MPSDLQRVARGLVDCLDEAPQVIQHLQRTADRCRENAQVALMASQGRATVAAQQLDAAARACEAAAHYLSMAPPKARAWAERLIGDGRTTNRPSSDSADRNKATGGTGDAPQRDDRGRTKRLTATYDDLDLPEDNEPPLITVARKALEKFRQQHEKDEENQDLPRDPLEVEILVDEHGEIVVQEEDEKDRKRREDQATADLGIEVDLTEAVKELLAAMSESAQQTWEHALITITSDRVEATFDYPEDHPQPIVVDINLPDLPKPADLDFDPALDLRPLGPDFAGGVHDPLNRFLPKEREIADRLEREGWRIDARPENHIVQREKTPDATLRRSGSDEGLIVEFKTLDRASLAAVKRNIHTAQEQVGSRGEIFIDGRNVDLSEAMAHRGYRMALGQPGKTVSAVVHVILGDGRLVTFTKER